MPPKKRLFVSFAVGITFIGVLLGARTADAQDATKVVVEPVREEQVRESVTLVGTAKASKRSTIAAQVEGWVEEIQFQEGDQVNRGDLLARLEDRSLRIQLEGAMAALQEAQARMKQAQADLKRLKSLWETRSVAEKALMDAEFEANARRQRVNVLRSKVENLRDQRAKKKITAPFDGWVAEQHVEVGEWVSPGGAVATLVDLSEIHVEVPVPERYLPDLEVGESVEVTLDALSGKSFHGRILSLCPSGDPQARTFVVEVVVSNADHSIRDGMLARGTFSVGPPRQALLVPKDALVLGESNRSVFVINDQKAHKIPVTVVNFHEDVAEVRGDVRPGTPVVVIGNERLRDGQPVEIITDSSLRSDENPQ